MTPDEINCLFCKSKGEDGFSIFGYIGQTENACEIIEQHFWFDLASIDPINLYSCCDCWPKIKAFHEFYVMVETVHEKQLIDAGDVKLTSPSSIVDSASDRDFSEEQIIGLKIDIWDKDSIYVENQLNTPKSESSTESRTQLDLPIVTENDIQKPVSDPLSTKRGRGRPRKIVVPIQDKKIKIAQIKHIECYMCHKKFKMFKYLKRHFFVHDPKESLPLECHHCFKKYAHGNSLRKHIKRVHETEKKDRTPRERKYSAKSNDDIICPICYIPLKPGSLRSHMKRIHENNDEEKLFICDICAKVFHCQSNLTQHRMTHLDRKLTEVQCETCGKWVKNRHILRSHVLAHEKAPEKCPHCGKIKLTVRALQSHIALAHSKPKHPCTICDKAFTRPLALREHMAVHTGEQPYSCIYCAKTFKNNANMYKHLREAHAEEWSIDRAKKLK